MRRTQLQERSLATRRHTHLRGSAQRSTRERSPDTRGRTNHKHFCACKPVDAEFVAKSVVHQWNIRCRPMTNDRVYIHEFIDIRRHNRANYMHHMTANWSPSAQIERGQLCYGVWALLGSTGAWPQTVNMWEEQGWQGLADSFSKEAVGAGAQDPKLARWWAKAAEFRNGGFDRIMIPAPWSEPIEKLCASDRGGAVYAHELIKVSPGHARDLLERANETAAPSFERYGWALISIILL